jgi:hypothetical protein
MEGCEAKIPESMEFDHRIAACRVHACILFHPHAATKCSARACSGCSALFPCEGPAGKSIMAGILDVSHSASCMGIEQTQFNKKINPRLRIRIAPQTLSEFWIALQTDSTRSAGLLELYGLECNEKIHIGGLLEICIGQIFVFTSTYLG